MHALQKPEEALDSPRPLVTSSCSCRYPEFTSGQIHWPSQRTKHARRIEFDVFGARYRQRIDDAGLLTDQLSVCLSGQQDMRGVALVGDKDLAVVSSSYFTARILGELGA